MGCAKITIRVDAMGSEPAAARFPAPLRTLLPFLALVAPISLTALPSNGLASESPLDLTWIAPAECPDGQAVEADVLRLAGLRAQPSRHLKARVTVEVTSESTWKLTLATELAGVSGERILSGSSCHSLADAATLTLALILNPDIQRSTGSPLAPPGPATHVPPEQLRLKVSTESRQAEKLRPGLRWLAGAYVGVQAGVLKDPGPDVTLGFGTSLGRAAAWVLASYEPTQDAIVQGQVGEGGRLWAASGAALGCWTAASGRVALGPCLGFEISRLHGEGIGISDPRQGVVYWTSGDLALTAGVRVSRMLTLKVSALGLVPVTRPSVFLDAIGTVHRPAPLAGKVLMGVDFGLP
jgi:hypothetical protein